MIASSDAFFVFPGTSSKCLTTSARSLAHKLIQLLYLGVDEIVRHIVGKSAIVK